MTHCTGLLGILNSTAEQLSLNLMRLQLTSKHERNKQQVWFERTSNFTAGNTNSLGKGVFCKHVEDAHIWGTAVQKGFQVGPHAGTWRHFMPLSDQEFTIQFHKIFLWSVSWHAFLDITLGKVKKKCWFHICIKVWFIVSCGVFGICFHEFGFIHMKTLIFFLTLYVAQTSNLQCLENHFNPLRHQVQWWECN